ncbi:MAG: hypothetical protein MUD12_16885 [Spirochaetes bacterium]|jgi:hypothetical protein|nr:hypothetical protein [Spirochaetota bacterium]
MFQANREEIAEILRKTFLLRDTKALAADSFCGGNMIFEIKKYISLAFILAPLLLTFACKSFDESILKRQEFVDRSVPSMRVVVNEQSIKACNDGTGVYYWIIPTSQEAMTLIKNGVKFHNPSGELYLSIVMRRFNFNENGLYVILGVPLGFIPFFLGLPAQKLTIAIDIEAAIVGKDGKIIKIYSVSGYATEYRAFYYGYSHFSDNHRKMAYLGALSMACRDLHAQLLVDAENIKKMIKQGRR